MSRREIVARALAPGDVILDRETGAPRSRVERVDRARARGYLVVSVVALAPRVETRFSIRDSIPLPVERP